MNPGLIALSAAAMLSIALGVVRLCRPERIAQRRRRWQAWTLNRLIGQGFPEECMVHSDALDGHVCVTLCCTNVDKPSNILLITGASLDNFLQELSRNLYGLPLVCVIHCATEGCHQHYLIALNREGQCEWVTLPSRQYERELGRDWEIATLVSREGGRNTTGAETNSLDKLLVQRLYEQLA